MTLPRPARPSAPGSACTTTTLPVSVAPRRGESLESWLEHLADANGVTTASLTGRLRRAGHPTRFLTLAPAPGTVHALARLARVPETAVLATSLGVFDGTALDLTGLDPGKRHSYRQVAARGWTPAHGTQLCPACLATTGTWLSAWRLLLVTTCTRHRAVLTATCPGCRRPFRDQGHSPLRAVGAATVCGNPLGAGPTRQCQHDLTTIPTTPAGADQLALQSRVDAALTGRAVTVLGEPGAPGTYLAELRHLSTLLLHLAGQPGADRVASWAGDLAQEAAHRTRDRGPRWGLRPPTQPGLRAAALAAADSVLAAPDHATAVAALTPWTELTPATTGGALGWLADRTVMTPTLTRLVTAARAPHRRLSHHLDTLTVNGAPMPLTLNAIPQVVPRRIYVEHLMGAFDSSQATVRRFASLCLARSHPEISSWAQAAAALGLRAELGAPTARACSASMRISTEEWAARVHRALTDLTPRDYRALEAQVHELAEHDEWFQQWVHACRPGTRGTSRALAITWLWVHTAHGHLDMSPGWHGRRPDPDQRHSYRQFARSLTPSQQDRLAELVTPAPSPGVGAGTYPATREPAQPAR